MEIKQNNLKFIGRLNSYNFYVVIYDVVNNNLIIIELLAKWFKPYLITAEKVNFSISISDLTDIDLQNIIDTNINFINTKYKNNKCRVYNLGSHKHQDIINIIDKIYDNELNSYLTNLETKNIFFNKINGINRKEKIAKLLLDY